ncbi:MAG: hypothetical protein H7841_03070 [Magnetospirillum sp. WYHS-4]
MRILFPLLAAILAPVTAQAACGPAAAPPTVAFKSSFPAQPVFYDAYSRADLARFTTRKATPGRVINGLTKGSYAYKVTGEALVRPDGNGFCAYLSKVDVTLEFKDLTIFVAKENPRNGCEYKVTLTHEMQHVQLYRQSFDKHAPLAKALAEQLARSQAPVWMTERNAASQATIKQLSASLAQRFKAMQEDADRSNGAIDTEQSYRYLDSLCPKKK